MKTQKSPYSYFLPLPPNPSPWPYFIQKNTSSCVFPPQGNIFSLSLYLGGRVAGSCIIPQEEALSLSVAEVQSHLAVTKTVPQGGSSICKISFSPSDGDMLW